MRLLPLFALWLLGLASGFAALEVKNPRWGFGGKPVLGTFNVLSVELRNTGAEPFDGHLTLRQDGGYSGGCAEYQQAAFVAPGASRWVQFTPFLGTNLPEFSIAWAGPGGGHEESLRIEEESTEQSTAPPAVVVLGDPELVRMAKLPVFPESLFPPTVSATDGLQAVVLDHAPRFPAPAQREAFLDWVRLGGIVHLTPGPAGTLPEFGAELAALNVPGERGRVGAGLVVKHRIPVSEITETFLEQAGFPKLHEPRASDGYGGLSYDSNIDRAFFRTLSAVTKPSIAWWLIYLLTALYIAIIGPVFFVYRKRDYRLLLAGFLGAVALFAWVFTVIGRRGYGENQVCHSVAIARVLGDGRYDVAHWSHAFATSGAVYHLAYPGASHLYAALSSEGEEVRGRVGVGQDAFFDADIPLFSFRNFYHRGVMTGPDLGAKLGPLPARASVGWRNSFKITLGSAVPGSVLRAAVQIGESLYLARIDGNEITLADDDRHDSSVLKQSQGKLNDDDYTYVRSDSPQQALRSLRDAAALLAVRGGSEPQRAPHHLGRVPAGDTVRLYVYADAPGVFRLTGQEFATGRNFVLFVQDFPLPPDSPSP